MNKPVSDPFPADAARDSALRMLDDANLDFSPKYIIGDTQDDPIDGLIRTTSGYYRVAEDVTNGRRALLYSMERAQLEGVKRNGQTMLPALRHKEYDVYVVSVHDKNTPGVVFRDEMERHRRELKEKFSYYLNLVYSETTVTGKDGKPRTVGKLMNGGTGFGLFEEAGGRMHIRQFVNLRGVWDKAGHFTAVPDKRPATWLRRIFSLGRDLKPALNRHEAMDYVRRYWQVASLNLFKARARLHTQNDLKTRGTGKVADFLAHRRYMSWGIAFGVGIGAFIVHHLAEGHHLVSTLLGSGLGGAAAAIGVEKAIEVGLDRTLEKRLEESDLHNEESHKTGPQRDFINDYISKAPGNDRRLCKKIDETRAHHTLRLLNHREAGVNFDDGAYVARDNLLRPPESLFTAVNRYFGTVIDTTHEDRGLMMAMAPNGLVSLFHIRRDAAGLTKETTLYPVFQKSLIKGDLKHLDARRHKDALRSDAPFDKITHRTGNNFRHAGMTEEEFVADLKAVAGPDILTTRFFGSELAKLFNLRADDSMVEPAAMPAMPVVPELQIVLPPGAMLH